MANVQAKQNELKRERWKLLANVQRLTERPMIVLSLVWLALVILDLTIGMNRNLEIVSRVIWALFVVDFGIRLLIAPDKLGYLRRNWLTALALLLPALRALRAFRAFRILRTVRAARSANVVRLVTTANRGLSTVRRTFGRRGVGPVALTTAIIAFLSAAGILHFELGQPGSGIDSYPKALWWAAMALTSVGSEYAIKSAEGRVIAFLVSVYALAVLGYLAGAIASHFIGQDEGRKGGGEVDALKREIQLLQTELSKTRDNLLEPADGHEADKARKAA